MRLRLPPIALACLLFMLGCMSPTVNIATQEPIEIKIDLQHEVRIQLDREVSDLIETEGARALTTRAQADDDERLRVGKAEGRFGERADGYLGLRSDDEDDRALVERVNASRRSDYTALAEQQGSPQSEIEKLGGANRIRDAAAGEWVQTPDGEWIEKSQNTTVVVNDGRDA